MIITLPLGQWSPFKSPLPILGSSSRADRVGPPLSGESTPQALRAVCFHRGGRAGL